MDELLWMGLDGEFKSRWERVEQEPAHLSMPLSAWCRDRQNRIPQQIDQEATIRLRQVHKLPLEGGHSMRLLEPDTYSPMQLLQQEVQEWDSPPLIGFESEAIVDGEEIQDKWCDSLSGARQMQWVQQLSDVMSRAPAPLQSFHIETEFPGQIELNLAPEQPVRAAQALIYLRRLAPQIGGVQWTHRPGEGLNNAPLHIHLSSPDWSEGDVEKAARRLVESRDVLEAFCAPAPYSQQRLQGFKSSFSRQDREDMVRIIDSQRLEMRLADSSANPYLAAWITLRLARGEEQMPDQSDVLEALWAIYQSDRPGP